MFYPRMKSGRPIRTWDAGAIWTPDLAPAGASPASLHKARAERSKRIHDDVWSSVKSLAEREAYFPLILLSEANIDLVMAAAEDAATRMLRPGSQALLRLRPYVGLSTRMVDAWRTVASDYMLAVRGAHRSAAEVRRVLEPANRRLVASLTPLLRAEMLIAVGGLRAGSIDEVAVGRNMDRGASRRVAPLTDLPPEMPRRTHAVPHRTTSGERAEARRQARWVPSAPDL